MTTIRQHPQPALQLRFVCAILLLHLLFCPSGSHHQAAAFSSSRSYSVFQKHVLLPSSQLAVGSRRIRRVLGEDAPCWKRHVLRLKEDDSSTYSTTKLRASTEEVDKRDAIFNARRTVTLVATQSLLVVVAAIAAAILGTPNFGLGPNIDFSVRALQLGTLFAIPLGALAAALDLIEDQFPELQDVTKATQRSVLSLMGGNFKPVLAALIAVALGLAAGFGEEMLFRGVFQYELANRIGELVGVVLSSIVFGLLHAVTPLYALLATIASVYFGGLYLFTDNLAVPIACHAIYDVGALFYAHWTVSQLSFTELQALASWQGPDSDKTVL